MNEIKYICHYPIFRLPQWISFLIILILGHSNGFYVVLSCSSEKESFNKMYYGLTCFLFYCVISQFSFISHGDLWKSVPRRRWIIAVVLIDLYSLENLS